MLTRTTFRLSNLVRFRFVKHTGELIKDVQAPPGTSVLECAHKFGIDIEGACGGQCACATCHVILPTKLYSKFPPISDDENDMLDLAADVSDTSRLGCQVRITADFENEDIMLPKSVVSQLL
jgi:ferredoxin